MNTDFRLPRICQKCNFDIIESRSTKDSDTCSRCMYLFKRSIQPSTSQATDKINFKCRQCSTSDTPEIRRGPDGLKNLCNKCGLAWKREEARIKNRMNISNLIHK